jgi:chlorite dismutase
MSPRSNGRPAPPAGLAPLDLAEKGFRDGEPIRLDRRLFMKFTAFGGCEAVEPVAEALERAEFEGVLYLDANDPEGIGVMAIAEDPAQFVTSQRSLLQQPPFASCFRKDEFDMLGRTYAIGYESDLEETLLQMPRRKILDPKNAWALWYPLRRSPHFYRLPQERQRKILGEHGAIGRRYGAAGLATDIRLACHGLDRNDNDFVIGLLGSTLHPLSAVVEQMRGTEQTAEFVTNLGPFFVGKAVWQSPFPAAGDP